MTIALPLRTAGGLRLAALALALLAAAGCRNSPERDVAQSSPEILYERARRSLNGQDYDNAIRVYEALAARFPFSDQARQARLDLIYAYYRSREDESAIDAAETFIRENPTHPRIDYAWYVKGLVDFERTPNAFERLFRVSLEGRPPQTATRAIASFRTVLEQFPKSEYAHDARRRMIYLRNRLAEYNLNVARYYMKRKAYVAAAQRSKETIEQYDGAPAVQEALEILIEAYTKLDLQELATQTRQVYETNFSAEPPRRSAARKPWWRPW
jgi:outer membrane protein assembly factor BamD